MLVVVLVLAGLNNMVKVCNNTWEVTMLEWLLRKNDIPFTVDMNAQDLGIGFPYLLVDGVPLDEERANKWLRGLLTDE